MSKGLLLARPVGNLILRRGKAVQSWKRPTMDEYLGPKEPWEKVNAQRQKEGWAYLLGGIAFVASTTAYMLSIEFIDPAPNPINWPGMKESVVESRK